MSTKDLLNEINNLRAELEEKEIQIEAMMQFENELSLKFNDIVNERDATIEKLQSEIHILKDAQVQEVNGTDVLFEQLKQRELEVEALEAKVRVIVAENRSKSPREILSESVVEYEERVEGLRRELFAKDGEINQLKDILCHLPSPVVSPRFQTEIESIKAKLSAQIRENDQLRQQVESLRQSEIKAVISEEMNLVETPPLPTSTPSPSLSVVSEVISLPSRDFDTSELHRIESGLFHVLVNLEEYYVSLSRHRGSSISTHFSKDVPGRFNAALSVMKSNHPHQESLHSLLTSIDSHVSRLSGISKSITEDMLNQISKVYSVKDLTVSNPPVPLDYRIGPSIDSISNRLVEEIEIRKKMECDNEQYRLKIKLLSAEKNRVTELESEVRKQAESLVKLRARNTELTSDLRTYDEFREQLTLRSDEIHEISAQLNLLKTEYKLLEQEKEDVDRELNRLRRSENHTKKESNEHIEKLKDEIDHLRRKAMVASKTRTKRKDLTICCPNTVVTLPGTPVSGPSVEVVRRLFDAEAELSTLRKRLEVEAKLELDLEQMKCRQYKDECIKLAARIQDLEYQLYGGSRPDNMAVVEQTEFRKTYRELKEAQQEIESNRVEILRLKNKNLEFEFDQIDLQRKIELLTEFGHEASAVERTSLLDRIRSLEKTNKALTEESRQMKQQSEQDKQAISEAERVLGLVEQTEAKFIKVAKENSKLKKDIASLNDDTFWVDLETLQNRHKNCIGLLKECAPLISNPVLAGTINALIGD